MARGARMGAQRESARQTMSDRSRGRDNNSRGSEIRDNQRASQNRQAAQRQDTRDRLARAAGQTPTTVQQRPTVSTLNDITGASEISGYQQGFTNTAEATTAGNIVGIGAGSLAGSAVEAAAEKVGELSADTPSGPLEAAGRTAGKAAATDTGIGLGGGLTEQAVSLGLSALGPVGRAIKTGLQYDQFDKATFAGEKSLQSKPRTDSTRTSLSSGSDRTVTSSTDSAVDTVSSSTAVVQAPTVQSVVPSIGISSGTDERKANFGGALAIRGKKVGTKRGKV